MPVQGLQHEAVAAQRDDDIGVFGRGVLVAAFQPLEGLLRFRGLRRDEGDRLWRHAAAVPLTAPLHFFVRALPEGAGTGSGSRWSGV